MTSGSIITDQNRCSHGWPCFCTRPPMPHETQVGWKGITAEALLGSQSDIGLGNGLSSTGSGSVGG